MIDPVKQSIATLLDRVVSELEQLRQEQLQAKSNRGWRLAGAAIHDVTVLREKVMNFRQ